MLRALRARFHRVDRGLAGDGGHADNASALLVGAKHARDAAERHTGKRRRAVVDCAAERRSSDDVGDHSAERRRTRALRVDDVDVAAGVPVGELQTDVTLSVLPSALQPSGAGVGLGVARP